MTKAMTSAQQATSSADVAPGKRTARHAGVPAPTSARPAATSAAPLKNKQGDKAALATVAVPSSLTSAAPTPPNAHAHRAPLPTAPTRLEASLTTVGDLARRYPSVAAFVAAGAPIPPATFTPTSAPTTPVKPTKSAQTARAARQPGAGVRQRFAELRAALAEGWEIVQPIFARQLWSVADDSATAFNFVLSRAQATRLVTVPEDRTVSRFIRDQQLLVDYTKPLWERTD